MASVGACIAALSGPVFAQDAEVSEIVVTASRTAPSGYAASTPTSVVTADTFEKRGMTNVADLVTQNPAFKADASPNGNGTKSAAPGQTSANLRSLGAARTLVLVNGARIVPLASATAVGTPVTTDLNNIPAILIDRAEVVTGGASAQWGSDAISGVLNILLNNKYEGLKVTTQYGITDKKDGIRKTAGALAGTAFGGGKGHFVIAGEWQQSKGIGDYRERDYTRRLAGIYSTTAAYRAANPGAPSLLRANGFVSAYAVGGNIVQTAPVGLRNIQFLPNGQTAPWDPGGFQATQVQYGGGDGLGSWIDINLQPAYERYATYARAEYDVTDTLNASIEVGYANLKGGQNGATPRTVLGSATYTDPITGLMVTTRGIQIDNPYLPASVRAAMVAANVTSFQFNRMNRDIGPTKNAKRPKIETKTPHIALGLKGQLGGGWTWDAHYTYGKNKYQQFLENNFVTANYNFAADAVVNPANGQIVCRATLPGPSFNAAAAGCVPANLFGDGSLSPAAKAYIIATSSAQSRYTQQTATFNVQGELFKLPAGPVAIGAGVEWRDEKQAAKVDELGKKNQYFGVGNGSDFGGKFSTKEAYIDSVIPLVKDRPFARSLDVTAAARISDYSSVGTAKTWKLGANWEPIAGLRFRVTESADFRAPAIYELFGGGTVNTNSVSLRGVTYVIPLNTTLGNPNLGPEKSKTFTVGAVVQPSFAPRLRMSVDYFDIKVRDAISSPTTTTVSNLCTAGQTYFCNFFTFNAAGQPTSLIVPAQNLASQRVSGIDFAANYAFDLSGVGGMPSSSRLDLGVQGTWTDRYINDSGVSPPIDLVGQNNDAGTPTWRVQFQQSLTLNKLRLTAEEYYISSGKVDNTFDTTAALAVNDNRVPGYVVVNLFANYDITKRLKAFVAVDNIFDKDPPSIPSQNFPAPDVAGSMYDKLGRFFRLGLTYEF